MTLKVITNNQPRPVVEAYELTEAERAEFDYLDWAKIEAGEDSASFVRYKGQVLDLGEFSADYGITRGAGLPEHLANMPRGEIGLANRHPEGPQSVVNRVGDGGRRGDGRRLAGTAETTRQ